ncbi:uncharacterized protein LOC135690638 [Rhopilema esculentum]|uniref:uncharacterized protein LOC135690638 n=1 Tax=Rhopilema esculentum TaxID=499914 RepID=UPI0031DC4DB4
MFSNSTLQSNRSYGDFFKNCPNTLAWRLLLLDCQSYVYAIAVALVILPTIISNVLLFIGMMNTGQFKSSCNLYIFVSSIIGVLSGLTGFPMYVALFTLYRKERFCILEKLAVCTAQFNGHMIGYAILALAIDRYFSVRPDLAMLSFARQVQSKLVSRFVVAIFSVLSFLHGLVSVDYFTVTKNLYGKIIMMTVNVLIVFVVYAAYLKLYHDIRVHNNSFRKAFQTSETYRVTTKFNSRTPRYLRELIKTISIILVTGMICYAPYIAMDFWTGWYTFVKKIPSPRTVRFIYYLSSVCVFLNASINAMLFLYRNQKAWLYVKHLFLLSKRHRTQSQESIPMSFYGVERNVAEMENHHHHTYFMRHSDASLCESPKSTPILKRAAFIVDNNSPQSPRFACARV